MTTMRAPSRGDRLSVVIASHNAAHAIAACLQALEAQVPPVIHEIIVADSSTDGTDAILRNRFPRVTLLHFAEPLTLPQLRGRGIAIARGDIIALLDPYSVADPHWADSVLKEHWKTPHPVIGGTVDLYDAEYQDIWTWAVYINEYGMFMPPMTETDIDILPGSNLSYKRIALFDGSEPRYTEFWKTFVNWSAESAGSPLRLAPSISVRLRKPIPFFDFLYTRFHHGRCFAAMRASSASLAERWARAATSPLLPGLFLWRWGRRYWPKQRYRTKFAITLPLQCLLFGTWAVGECVGYLRGGGKSCRKLFY